MSQSSKQDFIRQINQLQFSLEAQSCWHNIQHGLSDICQEDFSAKLNKPFQYWWQQCFELLSPRQIQITGVEFDAKEGGEFIQLTNNGPAIIDLSDWHINAGNDGQDFTFAKGSILTPGQNIRIFTAENPEYSFNSKRPIWNNKGDMGLLFNADGELVSSWVYGNKAHSEVAINHIEFDGQEKRSEGDEYIEIANLGGHWVDISAWTISAGNKQDFHFPANTSIAPFASIRVYTNQNHPETGGFSFNSSTAIWNNKGDTGILTDHHGVEVSRYRYGSL